MSEVSFTRTYAEFGPKVRDFEKTPEIARLLTTVLCTYDYPVTALIGTEFAGIWLGEGDSDDKREEDLDLLFKLANEDFVEIILRDQWAKPIYGGYLVTGKSIKVTDEIVSGYRVILVTHDDHSTTRHSFVPGVGYQPEPTYGVTTLHTARRAAAWASS
ncbi:MAG: hypothetical protein AAFU34_18080 [Pseudomonadota bacterium]